MSEDFNFEHFKPVESSEHNSNIDAVTVAFAKTDALTIIEKIYSERLTGAQYESARARDVDSKRYLERLFRNPPSGCKTVQDVLDSAFIDSEHNEARLLSVKEIARNLSREQKNAPMYEIERVGEPLESIQETYASIQEETVGHVYTDEELVLRHKELEARTIVSASEFEKVFTSDSYGKQSMEWASVSGIVARSFVYPDGWAHESDDRKGRIVTVAKQIFSGEEKDLERTFHLNDQADAIKLLAVDGPAGSLYLVEDGTHRTAGAMLAGLEKIPANVRHLSYPLSDTTKNPTVADQWKRLIEKGLIDGAIEENEQEEFVLHVESEIVPWIRLCEDPYKMAKWGQLYEKCYPGSLDNLRVPKEVLTNFVAFTMYDQGRFDEWKVQQGLGTRS